MFDLAKIDLPRWSALTVVGSKVTRDQAAEILIRTDDWMFSGNDWVLVKKLMIAAGVQVDERGRWPTVGSVIKARQKYRVLNLEYLFNERISSAYVDGPYGWCNWDGTVFCNSYNVGRWPNGESLLEDWQRIATAFPYLRLRSHVYDEDKPAIEFVVGGGTAQALEPSSELVARESVTDWEKSVPGALAIPTRIREFGCTLEQYKEALKLAKGENSDGMAT